MGTPEFAVPSLEILIQNGFEIAGVITAPDKPSGRGRKIIFSPIKQFALAHEIRVLQPTNLKDPSFLEELQSIKPSLQVVVAFRMLPLQVWALPENGTINLHGSLLPEYRGAAPINWAIINGEEKTGVTTFFLDKDIDTGKIIFTDRTSIGPEETFGELHDRLKIIGSHLILKTVKAIASGTVSAIPQKELIRDNNSLKKAPKIYKSDGRINWNNNISDIYNFIRGLSPFPGAFTLLKDPSGHEYTLRIFRANYGMEMLQDSYPRINTDGKAFLSASLPDGAINFEEVQIPGKKRMPISEFLRGFNIDERWTIR